MSATTFVPGGAGPNTTTSAAVHHDLYRLAADPVAERAELRKQARVLALGFLVFFGGVLPGLALLINGWWSQGFEHAWANAAMFGLVHVRYLIYVGLGFGAVGILLPVALIPFYTWWMRWVTAPLGWVNTRLILSLVFFIMFTPLALWFWLRRTIWPTTDLLRRTPHDGSYWIRRDTQRPRKHFERLF